MVYRNWSACLGTERNAKLVMGSIQVSSKNYWEGVNLI